MKFFKKEEQYLRLGCLTEDLLRYSEDEITPTLLCELSKTETRIPAKILALKSTTEYLEDVKETRGKMNTVVGNTTLLYDTVVQGENIQGHPDMRTTTEVFEVKTSGRIKESWTEFLMQTFAYAALDSAVTTIHLVLPLQRAIWTYSLTGWDKKKRDAYRVALENAHTVMETPITFNDYRKAVLFQQQYGIGYHAQKQKTLTETVRSAIARSPHVPYQIFLTGPKNFQFKDIPDGEIAETLSLIESSRLQLYLHAPYIINLCDAEALDTYLPILRKHLYIGQLIGAKGVVVHVGKSCKQDVTSAVVKMKSAILEVLRDVPLNTCCPLLLETPAGQGTEMLTDMKDFMAFASEIERELGGGLSSSSFGICVDTCHVFATGVCPAAYLRYVIDHDNGSLLKLIHFNDSKVASGACVDRHALLLTGHVGHGTLTSCAILGLEIAVPMLTE
jgi:deoxyribonuclease-4